MMKVKPQLPVCHKTPIIWQAPSTCKPQSAIFQCELHFCGDRDIRGIGAQSAPPPMETDNTTATGYSNGTIKQKRTKAMDMRFYWIKDRVKQGQFNVYWGSGFQNLADYFTKHHSLAHHKRIWDVYIHADERPINRKGIRDSALRGYLR
jgi:hypothetical protein